MEKRPFGGIDALTLHLLAMAFMLCDHLWATVVPGNLWLTVVGRMAFPLFAFMLVEGFFHTRDRKRYLLRLLLLALLSEIPFDLMYGGSAFYPFHQNVIWTLLIAFGALLALEKLRKQERWWLRAAGTALVVLGGWLAGTLLMVDYYGAGVVTVMLFYLCRGEGWRRRACLAAGLCVVNCVLLGGMTLPADILGYTVEIPLQGAALFSLVFVWLYNGRQGPHGKAVRLACYAFYPVHMLILGLLSR